MKMELHVRLQKSPKLINENIEYMIWLNEYTRIKFCYIITYISMDKLSLNSRTSGFAITYIMTYANFNHTKKGSPCLFCYQPSSC